MKVYLVRALCNGTLTPLYIAAESEEEARLRVASMYNCIALDAVEVA